MSTKTKPTVLAADRWKLTEGDRERQSMSEIRRADDHDFLIGYVICESRNEKARVEDIARAKLIAAAPEMLAALQCAVACQDDSDRPVPFWLPQARKALAAAT